MSRFFVLVFLILFTPTISFADEIVSSHAADDPTWSEKDAFDRQFALGAYAMNWSVGYLGAGFGLRARWEPTDFLGLDLFSEHLVVQDDLGFRHDHPIGFNLYIPFEIFDDFRFRPLFGMCAVFSFTETDNAGVDRIDDILFGLHGGVGIEYSLGRFFSLYLETQVTGYLGHERYGSAGGWSVHVGDSLASSLVVSNALGFQIHL